MTGKDITKAARLEWTAEQVALIRDTVASNLTEPELHLYLEIAAFHGLSPFVGEIYAARMKGKNGGAGRMVPIVGRNGWLKIARRHDDFLGMDGDVVREADTFQVSRTSDGRKIRHDYSVTKEAERGKIVGAWCEVYRKGHSPTFFYARSEEYRPTNPDAYSPWNKQESVMMLKCAQITALRLTYNMAGVYDEAEIEHIRRQEESEGPARLDIDWGEEESMAAWLQALVLKANEVAPGSWLPERVRLKLEGCTDEGRRHVGEEIAAFLRSRGADVPEREIIVDADVVSA